MSGFSARRLVKMAPVAAALLVALSAPAVALAGDTQTPRIGDRITLSLITSVGIPKLQSTVTVGAIAHVGSSDPIGTTAPLNLTVS